MSTSQEGTARNQLSTLDGLGTLKKVDFSVGRTPLEVKPTLAPACGQLSEALPAAFGLGWRHGHEPIPR